MGKSSPAKKPAKSKSPKVKSDRKASSKREKAVSDRRIAREFTTIGYRAEALPSAKSLKGKEAELKKLLGGKGVGLASMVKMGIPVPPAFNLSTRLCDIYLMRQSLPAAVKDNIQKALKALERSTGKSFGSQSQPLLLSVRSGAPVSMPGMMDTVLNLGLNTAVVESLSSNEQEKARFWWDCYRRFIVMFSDVVMQMDREEFEACLLEKKREEGVKLDSELSSGSLRALCYEYLEICEKASKSFPQDPEEQLFRCVEAVFRSWNTERARHYRQLNSIPDDLGTAVNVQAMVFGNYNEKSATGVVFTRNPSTGEKALYGEFLVNAQGEDVVAGIRTPQDIEEMARVLPKAFRELKAVLARLEKQFNEVQDVEFTIEDSKLFILQTRHAKRTAMAAMEHIHQFVKEKRLSKRQALSRFHYDQVNQLLHPSLKATDQKALGRGLPASPGAVSGRIALDSETAEQMRRAEQRVILVRHETSPEDIGGISAAEGILTATGGMTSHAAVVGRGMGKSCVVGCHELQIDMMHRLIEIGGYQLKEGSSITLNGSTGEIYEGELATEAVSWTKAAQNFFLWADKEAGLEVLANADTPEQARTARSLGAKGIGLCRTEHMFFEDNRLKSFREMILAEDPELKSQALEALLPYQREDFAEILKAMSPYSVCIRLLDPPLHEFLPRLEDHDEIERLAEELHLTRAQIEKRIKHLHEMNPMLGHRGCRLAITEPQIYEMQVRALAEGLARAYAEKTKPQLKIMIPLTMESAELKFLLEHLRPVFEESLQKAAGSAFKKILKVVKWGTMIELPRACLIGDEIAGLVDFISFGTNDLTQTACGISRDDASKFLGAYVEQAFFAQDPFQSLDQKGVGQLIELCLRKARSRKPKIEVGVCGEHGGDPHSIPFFVKQKFDSVSCSPFRVPVARLAAGRAAFGAS